MSVDVSGFPAHVPAARAEVAGSLAASVYEAEVAEVAEVAAGAKGAVAAKARATVKAGILPKPSSCHACPT